MRFVFTLLVSLFLLLLARENYAQNFRVRLYTHRIHADSVYHAFEDSNGMLWYTTAQGLYSYNGKHTRLIDTIRFDHIHELPGHEIIAVGRDKILRITNPFFPDTSNLTRSPQFDRQNPGIIHSASSPKGDLIILTSSGLFRYSGRSFSKLTLASFRYTPDHYKVFSSGPDFKVVTPTEIFSYNSETGSFRHTTNFRESVEIRKLIRTPEDSEKYIVLSGTNAFELKKNTMTAPFWKGLPADFGYSDLRYYKNYILVSCVKYGMWIGKKNTRGGYTFTEVMDGSEPHRTLQLPFRSVSGFHISAAGNIWVVHEKGISLLQESPFAKISPDVPMASFDQPAVGDDGTIYLESDNGIFEVRKDEKGDYIGGVSSLGSHLIVPAITAVGKRLWLASINYDLMYVENGRYHHAFNLHGRGHSVYLLYGDRRENLWVLQAPGRTPIYGLLKVTPDLQLLEYDQRKGFESRMLSVRESPNGTLYCSGIGERSYLYRYDETEDRFKNISVPMLFDYGENFEIHDLAISTDTTIWLASTAGLLKYKGNRIEKVQLEEMYGNEAVAVDISGNGDVWVSTSLNGIIRLSGADYTVYDQYAGLTTNAMKYRSIFAMEGDDIWVSTQEGFFVSSPGSRPIHKTPKPIILSVNDNPSPSERYPYQSDLRFDFISVAFPVETIEYAYRLRGLNNDRWNRLSPLDSLVLTNLDDGSYTLEIKSRQRGGYSWSDHLSYSFAIDRIWYAQAPAIIAYILIGALVVAASVLIYNNRLIRDKKRLEKKIQDRTREILLKNSEITAQMEELRQLSDEIASQRDNIEHQNIQLAKAKSNLEQKVSDRTTELSKANAELTDQNIQLEQFTFMTAHNLRAPIARLIGLTHIFNFENPYDKVNVEVVTRIRNSVHDLDEVVHDIGTILQVKKSLNGTFAVINLNEMIQRVLRAFQSEIKSKNFRINLGIPEGIRIQGIEAYAFSVFHNVISNSIKYSSRTDTPRIDIKATEEDDKVEVKLTDNGIGFDLRQQPDKLFKPFSRFHADGEGKGLGLYMIKIQMESMQGTVDIQSVVDVGTSVTLVFRNAVNVEVPK